MSKIVTTQIQHPSSTTANITLNADGTISASAVTEGETIALIIALGG